MSTWNCESGRSTALAPIRATVQNSEWLDRRIEEVEAQLIKDRRLARRSGAYAVGVASRFDDPQLVQRGGRHWVVFPLAQDPFWIRGEFPGPIDKIQQVLMFNAAVDPRQVEIYVAHELIERNYWLLASGRRVRFDAYLPQKPRRNEAERVAAAIGKAALAVSALAAAPLVLAGLAAGAAASALASAATITTVDPMILGAVPLDQWKNGPALWLVIAEWDW